MLGFALLSPTYKAKRPHEAAVLLGSFESLCYAAKAPRIFFIALASSWRMRSADTP